MVPMAKWRNCIWPTQVFTKCRPQEQNGLWVAESTVYEVHQADVTSAVNSSPLESARLRRRHRPGGRHRSVERSTMFIAGVTPMPPPTPSANGIPPAEGNSATRRRKGRQPHAQVTAEGPTKVKNSRREYLPFDERRRIWRHGCRARRYRWLAPPVQAPPKCMMFDHRADEARQCEEGARRGGQVVACPSAGHLFAQRTVNQKQVPTPLLLNFARQPAPVVQPFQRVLDDGADGLGKARARRRKRATGEEWRAGCSPVQRVGSSGDGPVRRYRDLLPYRQLVAVFRPVRGQFLLEFPVVASTAGLSRDLRVAEGSYRHMRSCLLVVL